MGIIMVYKPTYTWGAPVKGKTMGKKKKTSPIPRLKEERVALDKLVRSLVILSWGVGKPWENARKTIGKSEENMVI